jgi:hypothetical protein
MPQYTIVPVAKRVWNLSPLPCLWFYRQNISRKSQIRLCHHETNCSLHCFSGLSVTSTKLFYIRHQRDLCYFDINLEYIAEFQGRLCCSHLRISDCSHVMFRLEISTGLASSPYGPWVWHTLGSALRRHGRSCPCA